jgi:hypothetical protein
MEEWRERNEGVEKKKTTKNKQMRGKILVKTGRNGRQKGEKKNKTYRDRQKKEKFNSEEEGKKNKGRMLFRHTKRNAKKRNKYTEKNAWNKINDDKENITENKR